MFGGLSFTHILILLLVLVLVFGAKRIPEIGSSLGHGIKEFKRSLKDASADDQAADDQPASPSRELRSPAATSSSLPSGGDPKRLSD
jgi:sec-independent protein translocase protein TatA